MPLYAQCSADVCPVEEERYALTGIRPEGRTLHVRFDDDDPGLCYCGAPLAWTTAPTPQRVSTEARVRHPNRTNCRTLEVEIIGDARSLSRAFAKASKVASEVVE